MPAVLSSRTPQQALAALLDQEQPARLLVVGASELPAIAAFCAAHDACHLCQVEAAPLPAEVAAQRFDLVIVADCLEHLPKRNARELIAGIRNLNSNRLAVRADRQAGEWCEADFYALAMQASERFQREQQTLSLFTYDLHDYKQVPDWLNAKFWANPQHFGKYWW